MCIICKRGGPSITRIGPSALVDLPERTVEMVTSSLVAEGLVGRLVIAVFLNGEKIDSMKLGDIFFGCDDSLEIIASAE